MLIFPYYSKILTKIARGVRLDDVDIVIDEDGNIYQVLGGYDLDYLLKDFYLSEQGILIVEEEND